MSEDRVFKSNEELCAKLNEILSILCDIDFPQRVKLPQTKKEMLKHYEHICAVNDAILVIKEQAKREEKENKLRQKIALLKDSKNKISESKKVIKGLEQCLIYGDGCDKCADCPYLQETDCIRQNKYDALALLKAQAWHLLTEDTDGIIHGLPGDDGQYLMTDGKDIWIDDYVDGVDDGVWLDSGRDIREVKAWMYMPELPKQEGR